MHQTPEDFLIISTGITHSSIDNIGLFISVLAATCWQRPTIGNAEVAMGFCWEAWEADRGG